MDGVRMFFFVGVYAHDDAYTFFKTPKRHLSCVSNKMGKEHGTDRKPYGKGALS